MSEYWLAGKPEDVVGYMEEYHDHHKVDGTHPVKTAWTRNTVAYYSTVLDVAGWDSALSFEGEQGELVRMAIPQARTIIKQLATLITKSKLAYSAIAESKSSDVVNASRIGNALANQIVEDQSLDTENYILAEIALTMGAGFVHVPWRTDKGLFTGVDDKDRVTYNGDVEMTIKTPWEVYYDHTKSKWENVQWVEVRTVKNRFDLIAQFPDLETEIMALDSVNENGSVNDVWTSKVLDDDYVYVYEFYAKPTPAIPQGRMVFYGSETAIFHDGPNSYGTIPVEPMLPERISNTTLGYPLLSDLLPAQEMLDHSFSAIATNQAAFAVQNLLVPEGSNMNVQDVGGLNWISYTPQNVAGGGKPEPLQLTQSAPETFKFIELLKSHMEEVSNLNAALRGSPPPGVTSGVAIATLHASALEFITGAFKSYKACMERSMMHALNAFKRFAKEPHLVRMLGSQSKTLVKEFVGEDLSGLKRVKLPITNPLLQTIAGRTDIAEKLIGSGLIKTPQEYFSVIEGNPPEQLYETELSSSDRIQEENDMMSNGESPVVLFTDNHGTHVYKHSMLLNDRAFREEGGNIQVILDHIMQHVEQSKMQDPYLTAMIQTGQTPPAPQAPAPQQPQAPAMEGPAPAAEPLPTEEPNILQQGTELATAEGGPAGAAEDLLGRA